MTSVDSPFCIRKAVADDAAAVAALLDPYVPEGLVLPRPPADILRHIDNFLVAENDGGRVVGSVALRDFGNGLEEVRSLVVHPYSAGHGLGSELVRRAVSMAVGRGATRVFALTMRPKIFERLHFLQVGMSMFPQKVWSDCVQCPKRDACDEVALLLDLERHFADPEFQPC